MNKNALAAILIVVIVVCLGFVVMRTFKGSGSGGASGSSSGNHDFFCLACNKAFQADMKETDFMPLQMQGKNASKKVPCPTCKKEEGVVAAKCPSCGELSAHPGMMGMGMMQGMQGGPGGGGAKPQVPLCPKCKKPLFQSEPAPGN